MEEEIVKTKPKRKRTVKKKEMVIVEEVIGPFQHKNRMLLMRLVSQEIANNASIIDIKSRNITKHEGRNVWQCYVVCNVEKEK